MCTLQKLQKCDCCCQSLGLGFSCHEVESRPELLGSFIMLFPFAFLGQHKGMGVPGTLPQIWNINVRLTWARICSTILGFLFIPAAGKTPIQRYWAGSPANLSPAAASLNARFPRTPMKPLAIHCGTWQENMDLNCSCIYPVFELMPRILQGSLVEP